jgi:uncharacterized protein (TIGR00369 family)
MSEADHPLRHQAGMLIRHVPHAEELQMFVVEVGQGTALLRLPYDARFIGDPETGVLHGGVITSLLDNACGVAVSSRAGMFGAMATLDLRIDYMKPATPELDVLAFTECYRATKSVAFVRGIAFHTDKADPIATCTAAFMLGTPITRAAP